MQPVIALGVFADHVERAFRADLTQGHPERVADLRGRIEDWKREVGMASPLIIHE